MVSGRQRLVCGVRLTGLASTLVVLVASTGCGSASATARGPVGVAATGKLLNALFAHRVPVSTGTKVVELGAGARTIDVGTVTDVTHVDRLVEVRMRLKLGTVVYSNATLRVEHPRFGRPYLRLRPGTPRSGYARSGYVIPVTATYA